MTDTAARAKDPTAAERARRYRERKRHGVPAVTASRRSVTVPKPSRSVTPVTAKRVTLTASQEAAIDALIDVVAENGERPGPDGEPVSPIAAWRAAIRSRGRMTARQVRRLTQSLIDLGAVIERDGMVAVGVYFVDIKAAGSTQ